MPIRRGLRLARHGLLRGTAVLLILAAALVGLLRLALPWLADQPALIAQVLSEALRTPASLQRAEAHWDGSGPLLILHQLELGPAEASERLQVARGMVRLDLFGFLPGRHWVRELSIAGLALTVAREQARWQVSGLPLPRAEGDGGALLRWLDRLGAVRLQDATLEVVDHDRGWRLQAPTGDVLLRREAGQLQVGLRLGGGEQGSVDAVVRTSADARDGHAWLGLQQLDLADWRARLSGLPLELRHGRLQGGLWLSWQDGQWPDQADLDLQLQAVGVGAADALELPATGPVDALAGLPDGRLLGHWTRQQQTRQLTLDWDAGSGAAALMDLEWEPASGALQARLQDLDLSAMGNLAALLPLPEATRAALYRLHPRGRLHSLSWVQPAQGDWWLEASLRELAVSADRRRWPAVEQLSLELQADPHGLYLRPLDSGAVFDWPSAWPGPVQPERLDLRLALVRDEHQPEVWQLYLEDAEIDYQGSRTRARAQVRLARGDAPQLSLEATASGPLAPSRSFWMRNRMSPRAVSWLEQALDNGQLDEARFFYRGAPRDWPFAAAQGRLELWARGSALSLDFHPDWPAAELQQAEARIINRSLWIDLAQGSLHGVPARASGGIANFREPLLRLQASGGGEAADLLGLLRASPLEDRHGSLLLGMEVSGQVDTELELEIPLKRELGQPRLDGSASVRALDFRDLKWDTHVRGIHGEAHYDLQGFAAEGLAVRFGASAPVRVDVALGPTHTGEADLAFRARLSGNIAPQDLFHDHAELIGPILQHTAGVSPWQGELSIRPDDTRLSLSSTLVGTAVTLPAPLDKTAEERSPLALQLQLQGEQQAQLRLDIGGDLPLALAARLARRELPFSATLGLGTTLAEAAAGEGLSVSGHADRLDLGGWAMFLTGLSLAPGGSLTLADIDLAIDSVQLAGSAWPARRLQYRPQADGGWLASLDSDAIAGSLSLQQRDGAPSLAAQFSRLHLPEAGDAAGQGGGIDPRRLPALHFSADDLQVGKAQLGQTRIEAYPTADGLRFEQLEARSAGLTLAGEGLWGVDADGRIGSRFKLRFSAEDLGSMLAGLGFSAPVSGGQTLAAIDARWDGPPSAFSLERLQGMMEVSIGGGRLLDLDPGAGRIFGLLSLRALPRRLALDFRDVFETGLVFDAISGHFEFREGNAWTTDLNVRGPVADITIIGRTGMALRDYDQEVEVQPRLGSAFPVVGAIAGGPAGAAAGLLVQGVIGRGLDDANRYRYSVTGSWEEPAVERMDRPPAAAPADDGNGPS